MASSQANSNWHAVYHDITQHETELIILYRPSVALIDKSSRSLQNIGYSAVVSSLFES